MSKIKEIKSNAVAKCHEIDETYHPGCWFSRNGYVHDDEVECAVLYECEKKAETLAAV